MSNSNLLRRLKEPAFGTETTESLLMNEAAGAIDELVKALRLTVITAAQLGATDMELDEALTALEKYKAKP